MERSATENSGGGLFMIRSCTYRAFKGICDFLTTGFLEIHIGHKVNELLLVHSRNMLLKKSRLVSSKVFSCFQK